MNIDELKLALSLPEIITKDLKIYSIFGKISLDKISIEGDNIVLELPDNYSNIKHLYLDKNARLCKESCNFLQYFDAPINILLSDIASFYYTNKYINIGSRVCYNYYELLEEGDVVDIENIGKYNKRIKVGNPIFNTPTYILKEHLEKYYPNNIKIIPSFTDIIKRIECKTELDRKELFATIGL